MSDDQDRIGDGHTPSERVPDDPGGAGTRAAWPIAFAVVVVLLIAAIVYIALTRGGDGSGTDSTPSVATTGTSAPGSTRTTSPATTTSASRSTTSRAAATTAPSVATSTASTVAAPPAPCTAAALAAAVPPDVKAEGSSVTTFACTPSSGAGVADGFAWARLEAPNVDPLIVFYNVVPDVQPGQPAVARWQVISYGSAIVCDDSMPPEACNLLPGIPRR